jgi:hypothetical protein
MGPRFPLLILAASALWTAHCGGGAPDEWTGLNVDVYAAGFDYLGSYRTARY